MESDFAKWDEFAILMQMEEWHDSDSESLDLPDFQALVADRWGKQELQLDESLLEEQWQHSEKPLREQQLRQDEELARAMVEMEESLQIALTLDEVAHLNSKSHGLPELQSVAGDWWTKQELQSHSQGQQSKKLTIEQQLLQDEALAWRLEPSSYSENDVYDLFFAESTDDRGYVGVGCVIKHSDGKVVFENRVCMGVNISHYSAEYNALINGLDCAQSLGLRRINAYGNRAFIYWEVEVGAPCKAEQQLDAVQDRIRQLDSFSVKCVSHTENEDAIKLANYAAEHAPGMKPKSGLENRTRQQCLICLENIFPFDIVCQKECSHRFCYDCLFKHVETEISAGKVPVRCPQFSDCARHMHENDCKRLVSPTVFDTYSTRLAEASISDSDKVYCPFQGCSAIMCRTDGNRPSLYAASSSTYTPRRTQIGSAECMECHRLFCVECRVPWHADLTCQTYQNLPPDERDAEDRKLIELAKDQKWRKCGRCRSMIILTYGCSHMTCRCGNEFCYTCGTNYISKVRQCKCP